MSSAATMHGLLVATASGAAAVTGGAVAKWAGRKLVRLGRGAIQLMREFRAFLQWRAEGYRFAQPANHEIDPAGIRRR